MARITIVGAGTVGLHLARSMLGAGHDVRLAARDAASDKVAAVRDELGIGVVPLGEAVADTDVVVLAVPFAAVADTVASLGDTREVILVDATNTVGDALPDGATSILDVIAGAGATGPLVKAFNTIGAEAYVHSSIDELALFLPIAGDAPAVDVVRDIAASMGFDAVVIGDRSTAHLNESAAAMWIHLAFRTGLGRDFGFARLHR